VQELARSQEVFLADELVQRTGAHAVGQRPVPAVF
jgi:hypothetical protein